MPLDAIYLSALTKELSDTLLGGRIEKVQQPERDTVLLSVRSNYENHRLVISAGTGRARVHITKQSYANPTEPPMFCMLLRKHLIGAKITSFSQPSNERVLHISLSSRDELGYESDKKIIVELIGRSSNLVLLDSENRIIDCMRRMDFGGSAERCMLPGMIYRQPPKQGKPALLECEAEARAAMIYKAERTHTADKWLLDNFSGLSPLVCREISYRCGGNYTVLSTMLDAFCESIKAGEMAPYIVYDGKKPLDFSFMHISQYGTTMHCVKAESFSGTLDLFYAGREKAELQRRRSSELTKTVRTLRDRQQRKLALQVEELKNTENREDIRKKAELITANIYRIKKGDSRLVCEDYYEESCPEIEIALDPMKTPQQNSAALFREYNKMKAANEHLGVLIQEGEKRLDYLNSVMELLNTAESEKDLSDIKTELVATGIIKAGNGRKQSKTKTQAPLSFRSDDGFEILVGRSNIQNDELTTKLGRRTDFWLHTQKIHGSHVIIGCDGEFPTEKTIEQAAIIAAYYSQGRESGKIPVDYTMLKFVKKPSGSMPGKVIYTDYKTIVVESNEELIKRLKTGK